MDSRTPTLKTTHPAHLPTGSGPSPDPCHRAPAQGGKLLELGKIFFKTIRHFWPGLNARADQLPDTRFEPMVTYEARFLLWWGLLLFSFKLGSRRNLDFQLRDLELPVLANLNQLAQTEQTSLPVHKTLDHWKVAGVTSL